MEEKNKLFELDKKEEFIKQIKKDILEKTLNIKDIINISSDYGIHLIEELEEYCDDEDIDYTIKNINSRHNIENHNEKNNEENFLGENIFLYEKNEKGKEILTINLINENNEEFFTKIYNRNTILNILEMFIKICVEVYDKYKMTDYRLNNFFKNIK